ncbi:MAG: hypothetical protein GY697_14600, partial [Desulfobacterales bacterium]|nr:hypothetical protein [Desulfobacterales bacterium]
MNTIAKNVRQAGSHFTPIALFIISAILFCSTGPAGANADAPEIIYANSGNQVFSATLESDPEAGVIFADDSLVKVTVDGKSVPFTLDTGQPGQVAINGSLPGLTDGKHSAAIEAYAPDKSRLERRQALLFVDSNPPIIELVEPRDSFPRTA